MSAFDHAADSGLRVQQNANGSIRRMDCDGILLNLFLATELEGGPGNLYLRMHGERLEWTALLGPQSPARMRQDGEGFAASGEWRDLRFELRLRLARSAPAWFWHVELENLGSEARVADLVWAQDLSLADYAATRTNEIYVSHYLDYTPLAHAERGVILAVRQALPMGGRQPWALLGSLGRAESHLTDALQLHGLATRAGLGPAALSAPRLAGERLQHEHSMAVLQERPFRLEPRSRHSRGFFGWFERDHPAASSAADLEFAARALALPEARPPQRPRGAQVSGLPAAATLFSRAPLLAAADLDERELRELFGVELRELERGSGRLLSCFAGSDRHVVLRAKELAVLRPHGQILRTGDRLVPDESSLTTTVWMSGVFHSMLTQGHVSLNRFLSSAHGYLGLFRAQGQRIFVEQAGGWQLLDVPSAFEMGPGHARWIYAHAGGMIEVQSLARLDRHELELSVRVLAGAPCRFLISNGIAIDGDDGIDAGPPLWEREGRVIRVRFRPGTWLGQRFPDGSFQIELGDGSELERVGSDELLFDDGRSRGQPYLVLVTAPSGAFDLRIAGPLGTQQAGVGAEEPSSSPPFWSEVTGPLSLAAPRTSALAGDVARLQEILPWFAHDALIHYLAPRGLEQCTGGSWGSRDVTQGPVELLLALGRWAELRDLVCRVFQEQNPDGDFPQWFALFEHERAIRAPDAHGDIVFWPLLALSQYLLASEDGALLEERLHYFDERGPRAGEHATLWSHVEKALDVIAKRVVPGTQLAAFGNGDWNDSLQPADPSMRERLCSSWMVALHYQTFCSLARALRRVGQPARAGELEAAAGRIRMDFERLLLSGGVLAGFAYFHADGRVEQLLHPGDRVTGIGHRLLPMMHSITSDLFTPEQARAHLGYIGEQLLGPDGARLFDRPHRYRGGPQRHFQRAESAAYFGREIGLMYMHAHLRFAETLAHFGAADEFFRALCQANPIGIRALVPGARLRQSNCYHTSSDAAFPDRYAASDRYADVKRGSVELEGGWRVYSSGPGVALRLVHQCLVGLRRGRRRICIDPVIPRALDGLRARVGLEGRELEIEYRIRERGCGPLALVLNGEPVGFEREPNPYRPGGAEIALDVLRPRLIAGLNRLRVELG